MLGVLLLLLLQAVEIWRRFRFPLALTASQFWRRMVTAAMLEVVLLMWLVGEPLLRRQPPLTQLAYWSAALLFCLNPSITMKSVGLDGLLNAMK